MAMTSLGMSRTRSIASAVTCPSASSGRPMVMYSGAMAARIGCTDRGVATVTRPAPDRRAAMAARCAAPLLPIDPATIRTRPNSPLCASGSRGSSTVRIDAAGDDLDVRPVEPLDDGLRNADVGDHELAADALRGRQDVADLRRGQRHRHRRAHGLALHLMRVGRAARSARPPRRPAVPLPFRSPTMVGYMPSSACRRPGAEHRVDHEVALRDLGEVQLPRLFVGDLHDRRAESARAPRGCGAHRRAHPTAIRSTNTGTSTTRSSSVRAITKPSPPLLPRPASTATRLVARFGNKASIAATTCRPAFSISTSEGMPSSSIVIRSASRICAAVSTRMDAWYPPPLCQSR